LFGVYEERSTHNIRSLHRKTNNTMSDFKFDDVKYFNGFPIEELNDLKDEERNIMLAEREVDDHICRFSLGATVVQRKGYKHGTKQRAARLLGEADELNKDK
jgi:hypothetical protein